MLKDIYENAVILWKLAELRRNRKRSRASLEGKKLRKFRKLAAHLYRTSPYYREIIERNNIRLAECLPADFPVMTKAELMANFDRIVTDRRLSYATVEQFLLGTPNPRQKLLGKYQVVNSSGSTGGAGYFVYHRRDWLKGIAQTLRLRPLRRLFAPRKYAFYAAVTGRYLGISAVKCGFRSTAKNNQILALDANEALHDVIDKLNAFQPTALGGYTASLKTLATFQKSGKLRISPQWVEAMGESVTEEDKSYIQSAFGCGLFNLYGCSEHQLMGIGLPTEKEIVLYDDDLIYEFHPDCTLVTNLLNRTLPLIRYQMTDIIQPAQQDPAFPYLRVAGLIGRSGQAASFIGSYGQEEVITSGSLNEYLPGVFRMQLRPKTAESFDLMVVLDKDAGPQAHATLERVDAWLDDMLMQKSLRNVAYKICVVDEIPVDANTRKHRLISFDDLVSSELPDKNVA